MTDLIAIVTTSEKRKRLLMLLRDGPKVWEEIKRLLDVTASGMLPQIKILEDEGLIIKNDKQYHLTDIGRLVVYHLAPFDMTLSVIDQQRTFWQEHDIEALPSGFFTRIGEIRNPQIIEAGLEESFEPHSHFLSIILQSSKVAGITPFVPSMYPSFFLSLACDKREVSLILSKTAYDKIKKEYLAMFLEGLRHDNARLFIYDKDIRFSYFVTERYLTMGLFMKNGVFDSTRDLVSSEPSAIRFGEDLFSYYLKQAHPVNPDGHY